MFRMFITLFSLCGCFVSRKGFIYLTLIYTSYIIKPILKLKEMTILRKKIFFITIPMLPSQNLKAIQYRKEDKGVLMSIPTKFPGIVLLDWSVLGDEDVKIVTVRTDDKNGFTPANYELFKQELNALAEIHERKFEISGEIILPHSETKEKQILLAKEICSHFEEDCDIYMDITYGTKVTPIGMFSSLAYAEKILNCDIKSVTYGNYPFDGSNVGDIYDVRCLYELTGLIGACDILPKQDIEEMLKSLWG